MAVNSESESSDYFPSSNETQGTFNGEKYLHITKKGSIKWEGSFESLQSFFNSFLKAETKWPLRRGGCKQYEADNNLGEISVNQMLDYDDETTNTTDDEHSNADNDNHSNVENVEHSSVSLEKLAENFKFLENRVNAKVLELSSQIDKLKSNSVCNNDLSQEYTQNMVQENKSL
ncbi:Hypothetical predicted protein [Paramuricea clavata]|uniref:Uncharacterized protein n=1 Tax=Paramuricea clavata TaxID=317549 RepID=A0A7D9E385_PARCT|nr:Hypothetical predicted protein [Paramuricea clavata]